MLPMNHEINSREDLSLLQRDMEIARRIQSSFLPRVIPEIPGWEIAAKFEAARQVAGDFYDVFLLSGGKRIGLVIGDVCDKGIAAALFMGLFRSLIRAFADQHYSLGWMDVLPGDPDSGNDKNSLTQRRRILSIGTTALKKAIDLTNNYIVNNHGDTNIFATIFFGILDPQTNRLLYINAGHEPPIVISENGENIRLLPSGPAVGMMPDMRFEIEEIIMKPGDMLLAFTDGIIDARNVADEPFSENNILMIRNEQSDSADAFVNNLSALLQDHILGAEPYDDITILAVKKKFE